MRSLGNHGFGSELTFGNIRELDCDDFAQRRLVICPDVKRVSVERRGTKALNAVNDGNKSALRLLNIEQIEFRTRRGTRYILHQHRQIAAVRRNFRIRRLLSLERVAEY